MLAYLHAPQAGETLRRLRQDCAQAGIGMDLLAANLAGLLFQSCEAARGPARQCALVLAGRRGLRRAPTPDAARELVAETLRTDPPIHNTRRFLADEISVDGQRIAAGQTVLLVLAAAPRATRHALDLWRAGPRLSRPGPGAPPCGGRAGPFLRAGADAPALAARHRYRPAQRPPSPFDCAKDAHP